MRARAIPTTAAIQRSVAPISSTAIPDMDVVSATAALDATAPLITALQAEVTRCTRERDAAVVRCSELEAEIQRGRATRVPLQTNVTRIENEIVQLEAKLGRLRDELTESRRQLSAVDQLVADETSVARARCVRWDGLVGEAEGLVREGQAMVQQARDKVAAAVALDSQLEAHIRQVMT
jgi:chromosome segregation ATPase